MPNTRKKIFSDGLKFWRFFANPEVAVIKLFWGKSGKSRFSPELKQQEQAILKLMNSFGV